ncbi:hypothetical protein QJS10_CPA05g01772 [Acorus calamus]|uniref:Protein kinase domain-containing protein n=1 Tax=Acorus calamus TaxID=4465 RepID=A0AAV9EU90_ACOCL|nr:hypothetical protein QJS10_CPA05g01772 [Acorus calamus]
MAPEVMEQLNCYDFKADMWSFGITALELAHGHAPFSKYPPMKVFLMTMQNAPPVLHINREKKFRKSFRAMISTCLVKNLQARPSAERLLRHSVFKKARSQDYIVCTILEGLSTLGDHLKELKLKEDDMIEQQKIPDGKKEEMSQVVPAWLGCFPIKGDLIEAKVVHDQLSTMVKRANIAPNDTTADTASLKNPTIIANETPFTNNEIIKFHTTASCSDIPWNTTTSPT